MTTNKRGPYAMRLPTGNVSFTKGLRIITRKTTTLKAFPAFRAVLEAALRSVGHTDAATIEQVRDNLVRHHHVNGFTDDEIADFRRRYQAMPRRAPRKKTFAGTTKCEI